MSSKCNRLDLELLFTGELNSEATEKVQKHIAACTECSAVYENFKAQKRVFLEKHPFASFTRAHAPLKMIPWYKQLFSPGMRPVLVPVLGALIIGISLWPSFNSSHFNNNDAVRFKGSSSIGYFFQRDGKVYQENSENLFKKGDRIQIVFTSTKKQYLALTSLDVHGRVSFYGGDSLSNNCSIPIQQGTEQPFPSSIELDDSPGSELVVALFTERPLDRNIVEEKLESYFVKCKNLEKIKTFVLENPDDFKAAVAVLLLNKE